MFSGYISDRGCLREIEKTDAGLRFHISTTLEALERGESIAVDGTCLTVTDTMPGHFSCDLSPETLQCTRAHQLVTGDLLNLERSLRFNDRLHGHLVTGHVDQTCIVDARTLLSDYLHVRFIGVRSEAYAFLVEKGSIAVNGVSLTLNRVENDAFEVMLIPETLHKTNLAGLSVGDYVNVEYDYFAKLIVKQISRFSPSPAGSL